MQLSLPEFTLISMCRTRALVKPFHYITPLAGRNLIVALHRCPGENVGEVATSNKRMARRGAKEERGEG